jgi:hypothetical protein
MEWAGCKLYRSIDWSILLPEESETVRCTRGLQKLKRYAIVRGQLRNPTGITAVMSCSVVGILLLGDGTVYCRRYEHDSKNLRNVANTRCHHPETGSTLPLNRPKGLQDLQVVTLEMSLAWPTVTCNSDLPMATFVFGIQKSGESLIQGVSM